MKRAIAGGVLATVLAILIVIVVLLLTAGDRTREPGLEARQDAEAGAATPPVIAPPTAVAPEDNALQGFLYGRVTTEGGATYEGRLRFGGGEEAFWGDYFNGFKDENPWAAHVAPERLTERRPIEVFGVEIASRERRIDLGRPFMVRFGDVERIEGRGADVRVTLKSGTVFNLDRLEAGDFDDGVRVWDGTRGVVDLVGEPVEARVGEALGKTPQSRWIRTIEFLPPPRAGAGSTSGGAGSTSGLAGSTSGSAESTSGAATEATSGPVTRPTPESGPVPGRLHGTVRTRHGDFTGFVQWDREECVGSDELVGRTADGELRLRFDALRSIERRSRDSSLVTLADGREVVLSGTRKVGRGNRGVYVDDPRYGRVLVSWEAFERVDFSPAAGSGPGYEDFPPGYSLMGSVTTRDGRSLAGRLVYDLDESETVETLDAPSRGVNYTIPFGLVASIELPGPEKGGGEDDSGEGGLRRARVVLHGGGAVYLERAGDLGNGNAGLLVFADGREDPEYVPWSDVERIDLDRPPAMYPPLGGR